jgi:hypothetical protein
VLVYFLWCVYKQWGMSSGRLPINCNLKKCYELFGVDPSVIHSFAWSVAFTGENHTHTKY